MSYVEGGFGISKNVFKYTVSAAVIAVSAAGKLSIHIGNCLASKFMTGLLDCIGADFAGNIFTKYIDGLDGKQNDYIKIW